MKPRPKTVNPNPIVDIDVQRNISADTASDCAVPEDEKIKRWVCVAVSEVAAQVSLTVRIVEDAEIAALNLTYRQKIGSTNVLSFPSDAPPQFADGFIGDVIICAAVVANQARDQQKSIDAHWCHMVVHGVLHLLGYDHEIENDAEIMESREIEILHRLGFGDPYRDDDAVH